VTLNREILAVISGPWHPSPLARAALLLRLRGTGFRIRRAASLESAAAHLRGAGVLLLYFQGRMIDGAVLSRIEEFVESGGGLAAFHCAGASFKTEPRWAALLGGRFAGHGRIARLRVSPVAEAFAALGASRQPAPFEVVDELYLHERFQGSVPILEAETRDGREPVSWIRRPGAGRLLYCSLGHTASCVRSRGFGETLAAGLEWAAGGER
jgi:type 1 glutamine amidotransferase